MHIPDGFLSPPVWGTLDLLALPAIGWIARRPGHAAAKETRALEHGGFSQDRIPLMGVMGAFIFAAQMISFPVAAGTSGHLIGGALLSVVLGPGAAAIVMTAILFLQALVFQDGGVLALGANIFNMALAGVLAGYLPIRLWGRTNRAFFTGGLLSVSVSGTLALSELLMSGVAIPQRLLWASLGVFLVNGLVEGAITTAALSAMERLQPASVRPSKKSGVADISRGSRVVTAFGLAALLLACGGILIASVAPDGLQTLAVKLQLPAYVPDWLKSPLAGYDFAAGTLGLSSEWPRRALAALAGVAAIFAISLASGKLLVARTVAKVPEKLTDASSSGNWSSGN
jgi:cobalt/nickel transport system permease protein